MTGRRLLLGPILVALALGAAAVTLVTRAGDGDRPELQRELATLVTGAGRVSPGATAFIEGPRGSWSGAAGLADVAAGEPMRPTHCLRLESVSKAWTAVVVLQLVERGLLSLEDTVERRAPGLLTHGDRITVRQLLNHTSGLIDNNDVARDPLGHIERVADPSLRRKLLRLKAQVEADPTHEFAPRVWIELAGALPLLSDPGSTYRYSNIGYEVAAEIAAEVAGRPFGKLVEDGIVRPLALDSAAFDAQGPIEGQHAKGYTVTRARLLEATAVGGGGNAGAGGIVADARDEARFLVALMRGELLKPDQLRAMLTAPHEIGSTYALGLGEIKTPCGSAFGHNGGGAGFKTSALVSRDGGRVAVLLLNGNTRDGRADAAAFGAAERLFCWA
jgi:D-alanyl-D-alanine carboxypeptidase